MTKSAAGLGIDPGQTGALALVNDYTIEICDYTTIDAALIKLRALKSKFDIQFAVLEKIWLRPSDRTHLGSACTLLRNFEMWHTILHALDIHHEEYSPAKWRKGLISVQKQKDKKNYIKKASFFWPNVEFKRHDQAEAALMAYRAWQHIGSGWKTKKRA